MTSQTQSRRYHVVGDYVVGGQIGAGSFSTVWHARHRIHGTEVAIKEIGTARMNSKLHDSLKSEIFILKNIDHPNIVRLHDMIEEPGKLYIILEFCKGGDLYEYILQCQGRVPEATAKHFMKQLAAGLKVLREHNLMHRDLKPQNLLLSTKNDDSVLKIADFGFARSLQPRLLAETVCGSPLYMAPEIMQGHKYDAKADLWSVGTILFQLVTGKTPFNGSTHIQLLQNIMKSTELQFPPEARDLSPQCIDLCRKLLRRNPVERLTFEEFFNHPYLSLNQPDESLRNRQSRRIIDGFPLSRRNTGESSQEVCLTFPIDYDSSGDDRKQFIYGSSPIRMCGFPLDPKTDRREVSDISNNVEHVSNYGSAPQKSETTGLNPGCRRRSEGNLKESLKTINHGSMNNRNKVLDSLESIDQEYVIVPGPPIDILSSVHESKPAYLTSQAGSLPLTSVNMNSTLSAPVPIIGAATARIDRIGSMDSPSSAPGTSQGSMDIGDALEQPPTDCMTRIRSLQQFASAITELVNEKVESGKELEAFSIQLVILATWKQALDICHAQAASATGSPNQENTKSREIFKQPSSSDIGECLDDAEHAQRPLDVCSQIERAFLLEVGKAEELAKLIQPGNTEMPDAMELIFQSALALGRRGAVDEYMGNSENAVISYSKAVRLLLFLLVEAPCLILNPPFSLTSSDRYRIRGYIDVLNNRQSTSQSQRVAILKCEDQPCPP